jgi:hypothetical protein
MDILTRANNSVFEKDHNVISHVRNHRLQVMKKIIVDDDRERGLVITVYGRISIHFLIFYFRNITTSTLSGTGKRGPLFEYLYHTYIAYIFDYIGVKRAFVD